MSFVERHGLWTNEQKEAANRLRRIVEEQKLETIRLSFPDQHGILRGKTLVANEALASLESGCTITTTMFAKDTAHRTVFPVFTSGGGFGMPEMEGAADVLMVADPTSFRVLPRAPSTGWLLCDVYFADGRAVPFATRHLFRKVLDQLGQRGFDFVAGLEVAGAILAESGLRFVGLGIRPPTPSWGNMLTDAQSLSALESMPWLWLPPGVMIFLVIISVNFLGDGLRDVFDPRARPA